MSDPLDELLPPSRLEAALADLFPGFTVLERELEVPVGERSVRADLVGLDALGRLWFVARAGADEERALVDALDLAAFARREGADLVEGLASGSNDEDGPRACVVLVCARASETLLRRAAAVDAVRIVEVVAWKVGGRAHTRLEERGHAEHRDRWTVERFLDELAPSRRALAEEGLARLPRLDPALRVVAMESLLAWSGPGGELARLVGTGDRLSGVVGATDVTIEAPADLERWLGQALDRHGSAATGDELPELPRTDPLETRPSTPLLSAEELAAFRD